MPIIQYIIIIHEAFPQVWMVLILYAKFLAPHSVHQQIYFARFFI